MPRYVCQFITQRMSFNNRKNLCQFGHKYQDKPIVMICLDAKCQQRRLCCLVCIDQFHSKHELISLDKFQEMIQGISLQIDSGLKCTILDSIQQLQDQLIKRVQLIEKSFMKATAQCKQAIKMAIFGIKQSIDFKFANIGQKELFNDLDNMKANEYFAIITQAKTFSFKDIQSSQKAIKHSRLIFEKAVEQCQKCTNKGIQLLRRQICRLQQITKSRGIVKNRHFSKTFKSADISVNQELNQAIRSTGSGGFPIILIQDIVDEVNNIVKIQVKEQPGNKGVWMGVCVLNIVENHNFAGCYGIGKGTWAIDQVGAHSQSAFCWSHHDPNFNSKPKLGWKFQTGDIVTIKVDFEKSIVIFNCQNNTFEMPIKLDIGALYFFVGCTHINDKICIV